jgi:type 1 glutamine amidotransferase
VMGGGWVWDVSSHPPRGPVTATIVDGSHDITRGVSHTLTLDDEVYGDLALRDVDVLATARRTPDDRDQPVVWTHRFGEGRVAYVCFGHDVESLRHPDVSRLIDQSVRWAARVPTETGVMS